jgi:hypothetical protein
MKCGILHQETPYQFLNTFLVTELEKLFTIPPNDCFAWLVIFLIIGVRPILSAPFLTPAKNVCHPNPIIAKIMTPITIHVISPMKMTPKNASLMNMHVPILRLQDVGWSSFLGEKRRTH